MIVAWAASTPSSPTIANSATPTKSPSLITPGSAPSRAASAAGSAIEPKGRERRKSQAIRPMTRAGELAQAFRAAGFVEVVDTMLTIRMDFPDFADLWVPRTELHGATAAFMAGLDGDTRARIQAAVREAYLCGRPDGPRSFAAVGWAGRGRKPG